MQTNGRWYTPEGLAAAESGGDMRVVPDNSLNIVFVVTLIPDGDAYVANVKPLYLRYHAGNPEARGAQGRRHRASRAGRRARSISSRSTSTPRSSRTSRVGGRRHAGRSGACSSARRPLLVRRLREAPAAPAPAQ